MKHFLFALILFAVPSLGQAQVCDRCYIEFHYVGAQDKPVGDRIIKTNKNLTPKDSIVIPIRREFGRQIIVTDTLTLNTMWDWLKSYKPKPAKKGDDWYGWEILSYDGNNEQVMMFLKGKQQAVPFFRSLQNMVVQQHLDSNIVWFVTHKYLSTMHQPVD